MNAACTEDARASPSKNNRNGALPPTSATAAKPTHSERVHGLVGAVGGAARGRHRGQHGEQGRGDEVLGVV
jgi:hypothetical protein